MINHFYSFVIKFLTFLMATTHQMKILRNLFEAIYISCKNEYFNSAKNEYFNRSICIVYKPSVDINHLIACLYENTDVAANKFCFFSGVLNATEFNIEFGEKTRLTSFKAQFFHVLFLCYAFILFFFNMRRRLCLCIHTGPFFKYELILCY